MLLNAWVLHDGGKKLLLSEKKAINIMEEHFAVVIGPISCLNFLILGIVLRYYLVTKNKSFLSICYSFQVDEF